MSIPRLITVESSYPHEETVQRLEAAVREGGMTPFDHVYQLATGHWAPRCLQLPAVVSCGTSRRENRALS